MEQILRLFPVPLREPVQKSGIFQKPLERSKIK